MSILKTGAVQVGQSPTASNNFHWRNLLDGTLRLSRGDIGSGIAQVMRVNADNSVSFLSGYTGSADDEKRRCTAWVNFNGAGVVAIRDSYNVSSITDNGVGNYTVNFATAMANANYSTVVTTGISNGSLMQAPAVGASSLAADVPPTVNGVQMFLTAGGTGAWDFARVNVQIFGGKA